ncbi:hypothetical protein HanIR_Chr10g0495881 [Helianthus annuus]|nr:hypothetical protein HanIR_Chr10g0495881 [Helianthus annuus]
MRALCASDARILKLSSGSKLYTRMLCLIHTNVFLINFLLNAYIKYSCKLIE